LAASVKNLRSYGVSVPIAPLVGLAPGLVVGLAPGLVVGLSPGEGDVVIVAVGLGVVSLTPGRSGRVSQAATIRVVKLSVKTNVVTPLLFAMKLLPPAH